MTILRLELYVLGQSTKSRVALENIRRICAQLDPGTCELEVIDVIEQPQAAEGAGVIATPTLIKLSPPPIWRIVGDLSRPEAVLRALSADVDTGGKEST
jgi:circadian clock protein KaiB